MPIFGREEAILRARIVEGPPLSTTVCQKPTKHAALPPLPHTSPPVETDIATSPITQTLAAFNNADESGESALCSRFHNAINCEDVVVERRCAPICAPSTSAEDALETETFEAENLSRKSTPNNLKYERKSPTRSFSEAAVTNTISLFDNLPWHVMYAIFDNFELRDRIRASMVCRRWHRLLTDGRFPLDDLVVMNIFEKDVWMGSLSNNTGSKFQSVEMSDFTQFESVLAQCFVASTVKIWYFTTAFARSVLEKLRKCNVKMRSVDIYPYSQYVGIDHFRECLPDVKGLTIRPHGQDYFFDGLGLELFPNFARLDTLSLDCINLGPLAALPMTLTSLEWQSRNDDEFRRFMPKLAHLNRLQFLLLGHANFQDADFADFLEMINSSRMKSLQYLIFKFVKIDNLDYATQARAAENLSLLHNLQFLKFDLCYGNLSQMLDIFLDITSSNLRIISLNLLSDENTTLSTAFQARLFDGMARRLHERRIALHLGFLQRDSSSVAASKRTQQQLNAAAAAAATAACNCGGAPTCGCASAERRFPDASRYFELILGKFEASFVSDTALLRSIFDAETQRRFPMLTELKFIQCEALTDELLGSIATCCVHLRKLSILSCTRSDETGIRHFVELFQHRSSPTLKIIWKRDRHKFMRPSNFFLNLINEYKHLLTGLKYRFMCKTFGEGNNGEAIIIWQRKKRLFIQDFDEFDRNRILGFVLPNSVDRIPTHDDNAITTRTASADVVAS